MQTAIKYISAASALVILTACGGGGGGGDSGGGATGPVTSSLTFNPRVAYEALYKTDNTSNLTAINTADTVTYRTNNVNIGVATVDGGSYNAIQRLSIITVNGVQQTPQNTTIYYVSNPFRPYIANEADQSWGSDYATVYSTVTIPTSVRVGDFGVLYTKTKSYNFTGPFSSVQCYVCPTVTTTTTYLVEADTSNTAYFCEVNASEKNCIKMNSSNQVIGRKREINGIVYQ